VVVVMLVVAAVMSAVTAEVVVVEIGTMVVVWMIEVEDAAATVAMVVEGPAVVAMAAEVVVTPEEVTVAERGWIRGDRSVHSRVVGSNRCTELAAAPAASNQHGNTGGQWRTQKQRTIKRTV
jgi:hypothetical protein